MQPKQTKMSKNCIEKPESIRNRIMYNQECSAEGNTAVRKNSVWNQVYFFHVTDNKACDIMHDIYLGVARYNIRKILNYFIYEKKFFTLEAFNYRKQMFEYGPLLVGNVSREISENQLAKGNFKINASEMKTFLHVILLLVGDLINDDDPVFNFLLIFIQIVDIVNSDSFDDEMLIKLQNLIRIHHETYLECFGDTLKPKHHFMVHYPGVIQHLGPLVHIWCFRFESKHQSSKKYCHVITSRLNVPLTLAIKHSLIFSNNLVQRKFFEDFKKFNKISYMNISKCEFYRYLSTEFTEGYKAKTVLYNRNFYRQDDFIKYNNIIMKILMIFYKTQDEVFLILQEVETVFLSKFQSFKFIKLSSAYHIKNIDALQHVRYSSIINTLNNGEKVIRFQ